MFDDFVVMALEQLALAEVEEQWCDHMVKLHPDFVSRVLLKGVTKVTQRS